jgi:hypothetical protein
MRFQRHGRALVAWLLLSTLPAISFGNGAQTKKKKAVGEGNPVLWQDPTDIASRDLYLGPGGDSMQPDLSSITFIRDENGGTSKKYRVRDGAGRVWVAKIGKEAQSETAAIRLLWAIGYVTEVNYLVPHVTIPGKGDFDNVRFEARSKDIERVDEWKWADNPFIGTQEFQGLKVMMLLLDNWDIKDSNNRILYVPGENGEGETLEYIISDLGATFGKTGGAFTRSRNKPEDYVKAKFVDRVKGDRVSFHYSGKRQDTFEDITVEQAKWVGGLLAKLSDQQIQDAFRAANYSPEEIQALARAFQDRVQELAALG